MICSFIQRPSLTKLSLIISFPDNDKIIVKEATATGLLTALGVLVSIILFFKTSKSTES